MRTARPRIALAAAILLALSAASSALACAPCCSSPAAADFSVPSCCGCDGSFAKPLTGERAAADSRRTPSSVMTVHPHAFPLDAVAAPTVRVDPLAPISLGPPSPLPRRL